MTRSFSKFESFPFDFRILAKISKFKPYKEKNVKYNFKPEQYKFQRKWKIWIKEIKINSDSQC